MRKTLRRLSLLVACLLLTLVLIPRAAGANEDPRVGQLIGQMSTRQKLCQMIMPDFRYWNDSSFQVMNDDVRDIVQDYQFGAILYFAQNVQGTKQTFNLTKDFQEAAINSPSGLGIPLLIATDQEGGIVYRLGSGTALPGNMAIGATFNLDDAKSCGEIIGSELTSLGINTTLAPVVDVNNNPSNPVIGLRSYSDDATYVGDLASANITGLQKYNCIGCAKHFPGHGDTATDSHYGLPKVDKPLSALKNNELKPYQVLIDNDSIDMIMTTHIMFPQVDNSTVLSEKTGNQEHLPATLSKTILTDLLRKDMGFKGVVVTDSMTMKGITNTFGMKQACKLAINAGSDLLCCPVHIFNKDVCNQLDEILDYLEQAVEMEEISIDRIDDACEKILTLKSKRGILDYDPEQYTLEHALNTVGCSQHKKMERKIAADAVTVVKNENNVLPLQVNNNEKILIVTSWKNEPGLLAIGFNRAKEAGLIPDGAEVQIVGTDFKNTHSVDPYLEWADTIIINSEIYKSSRYDYSHWSTSWVKYTTDSARKMGKKSIVFSSNTPYDVQLYPSADAILAVYGCKGITLDPTEVLEGDQVSLNTACGPNLIVGIEVIFGVFGAKGKLPVNIPIYDPNNHCSTDEMKYERGFGCEYDSWIDKAKQKKINEIDALATLTEAEKSGKTKSSIENAENKLAEDKAIILSELEALMNIKEIEKLTFDRATALNLLEEPKKFKIISGDGGTYTHGSSNNYEFVIDADLELFDHRIYIDSDLIDSKYYTTKSGSTVVNLSNEYLDGLSVGKHDVTFGFVNEGFAVATMNVKAEEPPNPEPQPIPEPQDPDTKPNIKPDKKPSVNKKAHNKLVPNTSDSTSILAILLTTFISLFALRTGFGKNS